MNKYRAVYSGGRQANIQSSLEKFPDLIWAHIVREEVKQGMKLLMPWGLVFDL